MNKIDELGSDISNLSDPSRLINKNNLQQSSYSLATSLSDTQLHQENDLSSFNLSSDSIPDSQIFVAKKLKNQPSKNTSNFSLSNSSNSDPPHKQTNKNLSSSNSFGSIPDKKRNPKESHNIVDKIFVNNNVNNSFSVSKDSLNSKKSTYSFLDSTGSNLSHNSNVETRNLTKNPTFSNQNVTKVSSGSWDSIENKSNDSAMNTPALPSSKPPSKSNNPTKTTHPLHHPKHLPLISDQQSDYSSDSRFINRKKDSSSRSSFDEPGDNLSKISSSRSKNILNSSSKKNRNQLSHISNQHSRAGSLVENEYDKRDDNSQPSLQKSDPHISKSNSFDSVIYNPDQPPRPPTRPQTRTPSLVRPSSSVPPRPNRLSRSMSVSADLAHKVQNPPTNKRRSISISTNLCGHQQDETGNLHRSRTSIPNFHPPPTPITSDRNSSMRGRSFSKKRSGERRDSFDDGDDDARPESRGRKMERNRPLKVVLPSAPDRKAPMTPVEQKSRSLSKSNKTRFHSPKSNISRDPSVSKSNRSKERSIRSKHRSRSNSRANNKHSPNDIAAPAEPVFDTEGIQRHQTKKRLKNKKESPTRGKSRSLEHRSIKKVEEYLESISNDAIDKPKKIKKSSRLDDDDDEIYHDEPPEQLFKHVSKLVTDFADHILSCKIISADALTPNLKVLKPVVKVHIIDINTGLHLHKSDASRPVTTFLEGEHVKRILPVMTKPYSFPKNMTVTPKWNEDLVFNEDYLYIVREDVVVFFEILDFITNVPRVINKETDGWHRVAWAFLKLVSKSHASNTEQKCRLQLYQYPNEDNSKNSKLTLLANCSIEDQRLIPDVFKIWKFSKRPFKPYPSSLHVELKATPLVEERIIPIRSILPTDIETGKLTYEELMDEYLARKKLVDPMMKSIMTLSSKHHWRRLLGQRCKIPNKIMYKIDVGAKGAQCLSFSNNGLYLAVGCITSSTATSGKNSGFNPHDAAYPIRIYSVLSGDRVASLEGHQDLVYELHWSIDDDNLLSASSDGSIRVWLFLGDGSVRISAIFQCSSYCYTAAFHPSLKSPRVVVSGSFDGNLRFWSYDPYKNRTRRLASQFEETPIKILSEHKAAINTICFDKDGTRLYSGDANGVIKVWSTEVKRIGLDDSLNSIENFENFQCIKTISSLEGVPITSLRMHSTNRKLLVQLQDKTLQTLDTRIFRFLTTFDSNLNTDQKAAIRKRFMIQSATSLLASANNLDEQSFKQKNYTPPTSKAEQMEQLVGGYNTTPLFRSSFSPCGFQVWAGFEEGNVSVWKTDTGDLTTLYHRDNMEDDVGVGISGHILEVCYHPLDHIVAFCAFGDGQPVVIMTWDEDYPQKEILSMEPVSANSNLNSTTSLSEDKKIQNSNSSLMLQNKLIRRKKEIHSIADLLANSLRDLAPNIGRYPVDIPLDDVDFLDNPNIVPKVHKDSPEEERRKKKKRAEGYYRKKEDDKKRRKSGRINSRDGSSTRIEGFHGGGRDVCI